MSPALRRVLVSLALVAFIGLVGGWARQRIGLELDVESVRRFAADLGPAGPFLFVFVVAGRALLWLPSQVVLIAAGLCFGTLLGSIVGGAGLMISGLFLFFATRYAGREALDSKIGRRGRHILDFASRRSGAAALSLACGYPISPLSPLQAAAGLTPMPTGNFVLAAFIGGATRASIFAYFGDALIDARWSSLAAPTGLFALALAAPLAFPAGRQWLREIFIPPATPGVSAAPVTRADPRQH